MKLTTLKPRIQTASLGRLATLSKAPEVERLRGSAGVLDRERIKRRDCGQCQVCKRPGYIVDHIVPLWEGGSDADTNKQLICKPCHDEKSKVEAARRASMGIS
ncbi:MAG TPA: HNH endonuclease signature motif containing protein [Telluria sp.]|jgi:5-methylcytosine-specific restriction protein A